MSCVKSLHSALPWVSMNWLIFGEGEMDIYNKEHSDLKKSFDNLMALNDELRKQLDKKIKELKHYELRTNTCKV